MVPASEKKKSVILSIKSGSGIIFLMQEMENDKKCSLAHFLMGRGHRTSDLASAFASSPFLSAMDRSTIAHVCDGNATLARVCVRLRACV